MDMKLLDIISEDVSKTMNSNLVTKEKINEYKNNGFILCYSNNGEVVELTSPLPQSDRSRTIYIIPSQKYELILKLSNTIKESIDLHLEKIELLKKYVPGMLQKLTSDKPE